LQVNFEDLKNYFHLNKLPAILDAALLRPNSLAGPAPGSAGLSLLPTNPPNISKRNFFFFSKFLPEQDPD